jgi:predicted nucleic-acid-binding Zn-ribbon protein
MDQKNKCAKCSSSDLLRVPSIPGEPPSIVVGERAMHKVAVAKFVCADCGYIEEWVEDISDLEKLRREYGSNRSA